MPTFNQPELFLLRQWADAQLLEESMKTMRKKYAMIFEKVLDQVQEKHKECDARETHLKNAGLNVGVGKKSWRSKPKFWTSGFWVGEIRLEDLTSEEEYAPDKTILINNPDGPVDIEEAKKRLRVVAKSFLSKEELDRTHFDWDKGTAGITYPLLQSREELFELLTKDEARGFISSMVAHFESMIRFTAVMDEIHATANRGAT